MQLAGGSERVVFNGSLAKRWRAFCSHVSTNSSSEFISFEWYNWRDLISCYQFRKSIKPLDHHFTHCFNRLMPCTESISHFKPWWNYASSPEEEKKLKKKKRFKATCYLFGTPSQPGSCSKMASSQLSSVHQYAKTINSLSLPIFSLCKFPPQVWALHNGFHFDLILLSLSFHESIK